MFTRILFPTDFSESAKLAFDYAQRLAKPANCEILIAHACDVSESFTLEGQTRAFDPNIQEKLKQVRPDLPDLRFQHLLHAGPAGEVICWMAEHHQCDLIVMGTHGRGGLTHLLFGSVAEYVVRNARCPVLTIRQQSPNLPPLVEPLVIPPPPPRFM